MPERPVTPKRLLATDVDKSVANKAQEPRFPYEPGDWLRIFRSRCAEYSTPDALGAQIGVSGKTIVRWETDKSHPRKDDLDAMASVLRLTALQRAFLLRAFSTVRETYAPEAALFRDQVQRLLCSGPFPAILVDGLYYIRARNAYASAIFFPGGSPIEAESHLVHRALSNRALSRLPDDAARDQEVINWMQMVWLATAPFCGQPGYKRMLENLNDLPNFRENWVRAALQPGDGNLSGAPADITRDGAAYRVYASQVDFPPIYQLREYVPTNDLARATLERLRRTEPAEVSIGPVLHWSMT